MTAASTPSSEWTDEPSRHLVTVVDLRRSLGERQDEVIDVVLAQQVVVGTRTTRSPIRGSIVIESIENGVSAIGAVRFEWEGDCRRCLEIVSGEIDVDIDEIFLVNAPNDGEAISFDGERIDLVPVIRDAVALSLPLVPLCGAKCAGPDPDRYPALTSDERAASGTEATVDPRWAALDQLDLDPD